MILESVESLEYEMPSPLDTSPAFINIDMSMAEAFFDFKLLVNQGMNIDRTYL